MRIEAVLNCLFGQFAKIQLYSSKNKKITRIGSMLYTGTKDNILVEQYNSKIRITGIVAKIVFKML